VLAHQSKRYFEENYHLGIVLNRRLGKLEERVALGDTVPLAVDEIEPEPAPAPDAPTSPLPASEPVAASAPVATEPVATEPAT
jgi:hypothetical protein